jgi:hypothetical protein
MLSIIRRLSHMSAAGFMLLLVAFMAAAQPQASLTGKYEGTVKDDSGQSQKVTLDLVEDAGKYSGTFTTAKGSFKILKGQMANETLTLDIEKPGGSSGSMSFKKSAGGLVATFTEDGKNVTSISVKAARMRSGEWEAVADARGSGGSLCPAETRGQKRIEQFTVGAGRHFQRTWKDGSSRLC